MERERKLGVVLFQLGGPDSLDAVEPFLYNLFLDPDIIDFPFAKIARPALAKLISATRSKKVKKGYAAIGGKSPIVEWTARQARALEDALRPALHAHVVVAMRYWHPFTEEAIQELAKNSCGELVLLPLYPQYSKTTTGSSLNEWQRQYARSGLPEVPTHTIRDFYRRQKVRSLWITLLSALSPGRGEDETDPLETFDAEEASKVGDGPVGRLERIQLVEIIEKELRRLPPRQREAFLLRYWEELDVAETAAAMGCSQGSVKTHCSRAAHALSTALRARGIEL